MFGYNSHLFPDVRTILGSWVCVQVPLYGIAVGRPMSAIRLHSYSILRVVGFYAGSWNSPISHVSLGNVDIPSTWGVPTGMV